MLTLISLAALAPAAYAAPVENVNLVRSYKADESQAYSLDINSDMGGTALSIRAEIVFKVKKTTDSGAEVAMSVRKFTMTTDGSDSGQSAPEEMLSPFDKFGMPHVMSTENFAWIYILASLPGIVPGKEVAIGDEFKIDWASNDKVFSANGKGKALEIVDADGAKAVKLDYDVEVKPGHDDGGHVKCTTLVARDGASPISSEGSVTVQESTIKFKVKRLKS